jgi:hypothetical protein
LRGLIGSRSFIGSIGFIGSKSFRGSTITGILTTNDTGLGWKTYETYGTYETSGTFLNLSPSPN